MSVLICISFCCFFVPLTIRFLCIVHLFYIFSYLLPSSCSIPVYLSHHHPLCSLFLPVHAMCSGQQSVCLCVLRNLSTCSSQAKLFFFSSVCNVPNVTLLHLCPGQSLHTSTSGSPHPVKKVQKNFKNNYASVECGAKILSANSEAKVRHTPPLSVAAYTQTHAQLRIQMSRYISRWMKPASESLLYFNKH